MLQSTFVQSVVTTANICAMIFIILAGGYLGFKSGWIGYRLPVGYFPFGVDGMLAGASTVFFSYIGFDSVASTAEEVLDHLYIYSFHLPLKIATYMTSICQMSKLTLWRNCTGEEPSKGSAFGNWSCTIYMLHVIYVGVCSDCWFSAILCHGS